MATPPRKSARYPAVKTTPFFSPSVQKHDLSRERIAEDMAAFRSAGGKIEVLGNTPFRMKTSPDKSAATPQVPPTAAGDSATPARSHKRK